MGHKSEEEVSSKEVLNWKMTPGERSRTYIFPGGNRLTIEDVKKVCIRPSGSHRVETHKGKKYIVAPNWIVMEIDADEWAF